MWYLIIPPIIVIASLSFVLWYLSRKGADPRVAETLSHLEGQAEQKISFVRTKTFFLHLLEKIAYRFKVTSLQMHNAFHNVTQYLKERQRRFQAKDTGDGMAVSSEQSLLQANDTVVREVPSSTPLVTETILEAPIVRNRTVIKPAEPMQKEVQARVSIESDSASQLAVSQSMVHPEPVPVDKAREEEYITRIAVNPKDFMAYESLGDYYLEIGNVKDAKECYRQVLKLSPVQRMVKIKIRRLEKIFTQTME